MDIKEIKAELERLTEEKKALETLIAVSESKVEEMKSRLAESEGKVLELVGSTEPEKVREYLEKLEVEIAEALSGLR